MKLGDVVYFKPDDFPYIKKYTCGTVTQLNPPGVPINYIRWSPQSEGAPSCLIEFEDDITENFCKRWHILQKEVEVIGHVETW